MSIRFVIGRAGTGKTHHCLEAIRTRLAHDPLDGPRLILLVPEQAGLQMEQAVLQPPAGASGEPTGAAHRAEVLSFERLADRVLESAGTAARCTLTEPARAMVIRRLLTRHRNELEYFGRFAYSGRGRARLTGVCESLGAAIAELIQEGVDPEALSFGDGKEPTGSHDGPDDNPAQRAKFRDLRLLYGAYLDYLGADRVDPTQRLAIAREALPRCRWLHGARLWVDGFASLSDQEARTLIALAALCQHVDITVLADPALCALPDPSAGGRIGAGGSRGRRLDDAGQLFHRTVETWQELARRFTRAGLEIHEPLILDPPVPHRFRNSAPLARLERSIFCTNDTHGSPTAAPPDGIELVALPTRRLEVEYAVSRVCQWVRESGGRCRYRDLAIIVRDLEPYHDLFSAALTARNVPFFIDRRRPIAHHPLAELLRAGCALAAENLSLSAVRLALKTGLFAITEYQADELENYLLANGIEGSTLWRGKEWVFPLRPGLKEPQDQPPDSAEQGALARINDARRTLLDGLDAWLTFAAVDRHATARDWVAAIHAWLQRLDVSRTLRRWSVEAESHGRLDEADEHRQAWRETMSLLDDLAFALGDERLTVREVAELLDAGLSGMTLGLVPPTVDQVLVASIERSRHPDIKAAAVVGLNDGVFPKRIAEDPVLNDDDREALIRAGAPVRPGSRARTLDEALLAYVALTRASEKLAVTCSQSDENGQSLRPSLYVAALQTACPGLSMDSPGDPDRTRGTWDVLTLPDLAGRFAGEFRRRAPVTVEPQPRRRALFNALYDLTRLELQQDAACRFALRSLADPPELRLSRTIVQRMYGEPLRSSVSQLESFAACPFQHFARYGLRLRERAEATLEPVDTGQVTHAILEDFVHRIAQRQIRFAQLGDDELLAELAESCARLAARLPEAGTWSSARDAYVLRRSAESLARLLRAQRAVSGAGRTQPRAAELPFGFDDASSLPPLELTTPRGRRVLLRGFIDRVDLAELGDELLGVVIDYKSTRDKRLDFSEVYHGLSLQLPAYLLVLAARGESFAGRPIRPIGALYFSLARQYELKDHPTDKKENRSSGPESFRPRGMILAEDFPVLDSATAQGWSAHFSVYRKKDGTLGREDSGDAVSSAGFTGVLDHTRHTLGRLADALLDGDVSVRPYRLGTLSPCSWCPYPAVCRFEMGLHDVRFLEKLNRSEIIARLEESRGARE